MDAVHNLTIKNTPYFFFNLLVFTLYQASALSALISFSDNNTGFIDFINESEGS